MRIKMMPPPIDIGRLREMSAELAGAEERPYKWTAVMILEMPH
jgi:hypothetical protein